jgi:hypothetical protein
VKLIGIPRRHTVDSPCLAASRELSMPKLEYDVCARCGTLFDDQGENGWWIRESLWWHECDNKRPARIVVRKLELKKDSATAA